MEALKAAAVRAHPPPISAAPSRMRPRFASRVSALPTSMPTGKRPSMPSPMPMPSTKR